jgi:altronate hydrolase
VSGRQASRVIRLGPGDNVVVARDNLASGDEIPEENLTVRDPVARGHKVAARAIGAGEPVRKLGAVIGVACGDIAKGAHVHVHNCVMDGISGAPPDAAQAPTFTPLPAPGRTTFDGLIRPSGRVGTRNFIAVLVSVNCAAGVARMVHAACERGGLLQAYPNVDGVIPLVHATGCGMVSGGDDMAILQRVLWGCASNPNVGGVLLIGLGCEVNQIPHLLETHGLEEGERFRTLVIQDEGGTRATIDAALAILADMLPLVNGDRRQEAPVSELVLALQCGGSDGHSAITANPALGIASDILVGLGGTSILSETPEIHGAESLLYARAASGEVRDRLAARLRWWEDYMARNGASFNSNPSPGNLAGGITTIIEKSLGSVAKGGNAPLADVCLYAERVPRKGLIFMDSPGYDPCSATGQVAAGATVMCFTTGRGSVFGCRPVPSIKITSNTHLFERMRDDMDLNAGEIAEGGKSIEEVGAEIFERILDVAGGQRTKSEDLGFGLDEFIPWQTGAVL